MQTVNKDLFLSRYSATYAPNNGLSGGQKSGIATLLDCLMADDQVDNIQWAAYMMATVKHECAGTWQPVAEYGKGAGRPYGKPAANGQVYYGRGYVQLTWEGNYKTMSSVTGKDLVSHPELAMEPDTAYRIMSYGMRNGSFTGVGLKHYINDAKVDYVNARKIINGLDCAEKIADYAKTIEGLLKGAM